ncbi:unnamed protein product [Rhizoctonia solani]|uniref:Nephrocystin 3-like N-terminal domain-containing protein n=1 Tax=Rhizoctonia solani TaxID=456999 RepID=A0A8H2XNJ7_9AGAM|nr:unnamed protein product [Rhizoctonia solani]
MLSPLKSVLHDLKELLMLYENAVDATKEYQILRSQLEGLFQDLSSHFTGGASQVMTTSIQNLCGAIESELRQTYGSQDRNNIPRYLQAERGLSEIMECYLRIQSRLERLVLNVNLSIWAIVDEQEVEARLAKITPSMSASYNSAEAALVRRRECTPKTREQVLQDLETWKNNRNGEKICWMNGMAGTGKTTISTTVCSILEKRHELGASFLCSRLLPECRNVKLILPTLAYQLARFSIPF